MILRRYWIKFDLRLEDPHPLGTLPGCGVTAYNYEDALQLIQARVFKNADLPPVSQVIEDVDISTLDPNHVLPNMAVPVRRGVWFPMGYDG